MSHDRQVPESRTGLRRLCSSATREGPEKTWFVVSTAVLVLLGTLAFSPRASAQDAPSGDDGITPQQAAQNQPLPVSTLSVVPVTGGIELRWPGTGEDLRGYRLARCAAADDCEVRRASPLGGEIAGCTPMSMRRRTWAMSITTR
jgi:hypothetical protein